MIQIYSPTNTNFSMNGNSVLFPESCETRAKLNGEWYLDVSHPLDEEGRWKYIVEESVISAPTFMGENQLFRIDDVEKSDDGVKAKAYPIFFDSADELFIYSCKPSFVNGQKALDMMTSGTKFSGSSDITKTNTAEFINRNLMDCINGDDPAFIRYWGGDVLYDNYKVIINTRAGSNRGFQIRYRRNMDGISRKVDMSNVVTRIVPVAYNGRMITNKYVDSSNIGKYAKVYIRLMEFPNVKLAADASEEEEEGITVCATQTALNTTLTNLCREQFNTGIDLPNVTLNVDMVDLSDTEEYKEFAGLEKVSLGDTVGVYHRDLDISTEERVIEIVWDCIRNKATKLTLGDYEYDYLIDGNKQALDKWRENYQNALAAWKEKFNQQEDQFTQVSQSVTELQNNFSTADSEITALEAAMETLQDDVDVLEELSGVTKDYTVETGTSGVWTYRKWNNGRAEISGKLPVNALAISTAMGALFRNANVLVFSGYTFPFSFKETPVVSTAFNPTNGVSGLVWYSGELRTNRPPDCYLIRHDSGSSATGTISFRAEGKWK